MDRMDLSFWPRWTVPALYALALLAITAGIATTLEYRAAAAFQSAADDRLDASRLAAPCSATTDASMLPMLETQARQSLSDLGGDRWSVEALVQTRLGNREVILAGRFPTSFIRYVGLPDIVVESRAEVSCVL